MLNRINHMIPDLFLKPDYLFLRHSLIQLIVLLITVNILWDEPVQASDERIGAWIIYFLLINMVIYVNMYLLVPQFLLKGRTWVYLLLSFLLILCVMAGVTFIESLTEGNDTNINSTPEFLGLLSGFSAFSLFIAGLTTFQLFKYRMENRKKINELENVTAAIELANLQNQINPHFLFNMLNNANIMAGENVSKSSEILSKLKTLLRYQVDEGSKETVRLKDDIAFIGDYLELEKIRRDRFSYTIQSEGNTDVIVPPLLFIPFVENAVKHNPENDSYVRIIFRITDQKLYFECENPKARFPQPPKDGGIGLANIRRRLDLLFEKGYNLHITDQEDSYMVIMNFRIPFIE